MLIYLDHIYFFTFACLKEGALTRHCHNTHSPSMDMYYNKYAIYAYTHGPVTGSGPSVVWP